MSKDESEGRAIKHSWKGLLSAVDVLSYVLLCMSTSTPRGLEKENNEKNCMTWLRVHVFKGVWNMRNWNGWVMGYGHYNIALILKDLCTIGIWLKVDLMILSLSHLSTWRLKLEVLKKLCSNPTVVLTTHYCCIQYQQYLEATPPHVSQ